MPALVVAMYVRGGVFRTFGELEAVDDSGLMMVPITQYYSAVAYAFAVRRLLPRIAEAPDDSCIGGFEAAVVDPPLAAGGDW